MFLSPPAINLVGFKLQILSGNGSNLGLVLLSLAALCAVCPCTWLGRFKGQARTRAEFEHRTWGSPSGISPISPFSSGLFRTLFFPGINLLIYGSLLRDGPFPPVAQGVCSFALNSHPVYFTPGQLSSPAVQPSSGVGPVVILLSSLGWDHGSWVGSQFCLFNIEFKRR